MTVYVPAAVTVIEDVVAPVLQRSEPVAEVDSIEVLLQLSTTVTEGAEGFDFGAAVPEPASLLQPFTVCVTVYIPAAVTVIVEVVADPELHNNDPVAEVDKTEVPSQLSTTVTEGAGGVGFGAAVPEPAELVQPFTVWVTV